MKEAAISAAALLGLLAFAGVYNHNQVNRARRDTTSDASASYDDSDTVETALGISDIANMSADNWAQIQLDIGIPESDLLPFELDGAQPKQGGSDDYYEDDDSEDDESENEGGLVIEARARRRKKQGGANINKFKIRDVPKLHEKMNEAYAFRQDTLLKNFVADSNVQVAQRMPIDFLDETAQAAAHIVDGEYPDYSGNDKTSPSIQKFLTEFNYNDAGTNLFSEGAAQIWFLVPAAVPLMSADAADHLSDYSEYWNFIAGWKDAFEQTTSRAGNNLRVSVGLYHKGAVYSPRGTLYRAGRFPWNRIKNFYLRPRTTTAMPYVIPTAESLLSWIPRFGASSAAAGQDCYTVWFHQDFAADANQLLLTDQFAKVDQLYEMCNVMHVFVGMDESNADVKAYAATLVPGLQSKVSKDPDFSGVFFVDKLANLNTGDLRSMIYKHMTILKGRAGCRVVENGYVPPPSEVDSTGFLNLEPTYADYQQAPAATGGAVIEMTYPEVTYADATVRAFVEQEPTEAPKIPEIDSCCGHDLYGSTPYDSELRTCCDDGSPKSFTRDGSDPCMADIFDYNF